MKRFSGWKHFPVVKLSQWKAFPTFATSQAHEKIGKLFPEPSKPGNFSR
jgi:hypothetical protein